MGTIGVLRRTALGVLATACSLLISAASYAQSSPTPERVIVLGDSVGAGAGASKTALMWPMLLVANESTAYPNQVGQDLNSKFRKRLPVISRAFGGAVTQNIIDTELPALSMNSDQITQRYGSELRSYMTYMGEPLHYPVRGHSIVLMSISGNDCLMNWGNNVSLSSALAPPPAQSSMTMAGLNVAGAVAFFNNRALFPDGVSIFWSAVYDPTDGLGHDMLYFKSGQNLTALVQGWNAGMSAGASAMGNSMHFVNLAPSFMGHAHNYYLFTNARAQKRFPGSGTYWMYDIVHPNDAGHDAIRKAYWAKIREIFP